MGRMAYVELESGMVLETENPGLWKEGKRLTAAEGVRRLEERALETLRDMLQPGARVYTKVETVSRSGMRREISAYVARVDGDRGPYIARISGHVARAIGARLGPSGGCIMHGCGMDMGFELVYRLGCALWPEGTPEPHGTRNGSPDTAGGYALKQEWL